MQLGETSFGTRIGTRVVLVLGLLFIYTPIFIIMAYSFSASSFVHIWGGFSLKWYAALFRDAELWRATWISLKIAFTSATLAVILGTLSALSLTRFKEFRGRQLFSGLTTAPLVMPEIMTGLSLLLLFITCSNLFGWPVRRGFVTICIGHTTLAMAYVTAIVAARLQDFDRSLEEAALDLGAKPLKVIFYITLPIISPALVAGWLLAFMLSFDDVVISSFVSGPGVTTLPMVIFSRIRMGISPEINALATLLIVTLSLAIGIFGWVKLREISSKRASHTV